VSHHFRKGNTYRVVHKDKPLDEHVIEVKEVRGEFIGVERRFELGRVEWKWELASAYTSWVLLDERCEYHTWGTWDDMPPLKIGQIRVRVDQEKQTIDVQEKLMNMNVTHHLDLKAQAVRDGLHKLGWCDIKDPVSIASAATGG